MPVKINKILKKCFVIMVNDTHSSKDQLLKLSKQQVKNATYPSVRIYLFSLGKRQIFHLLLEK